MVQWSIQKYLPATLCLTGFARILIVRHVRTSNLYENFALFYAKLVVSRTVRCLRRFSLQRNVRWDLTAPGGISSSTGLFIHVARERHVMDTNF